MTGTDRDKLPLAHPTGVTWVTITMILTIVALYVLWAYFIAEPSIMR